MGLGFHIGQDGIEHLGEYLGQLEMEEHQWLQKNGFLLYSKTEHVPSTIESIPFFKDVILTHDQILAVKKSFDSRKKEVMKTSRFQSSAMDKLEKIFNRLIEEEKGLSTCAD